MSPAPEAALAAWGALGSAEWVALLAFTAWRLARTPVFEEQAPAAAATSPLPRVSVVIPARDQEATIDACVRGLLAQEHRDIEVIVVDDRSVDRTGAIVEAIAREDGRVVVERVRDLPEGWLGKVHALEVGRRRATGELVLFADADVELAPPALGRAAAICRDRALDHLTVLPRVRPRGFVLGGLMAAVGCLVIARYRRYVGIGAFNLVRRASFERTDGFAWLRMEVIDDMGVGLLMSRAGLRSTLLLSRGDVALEWYGSAGEMLRGLERNVFSGAAGFSYGWAALHVLHLLLVVGAPLAALATPASRPFGIAALAALVAFATVASARLRRPATELLLFPAALVFFAVAIARSALAFFRDGGVVWRGTLYPAEALRAGRRLGSWKERER